MRLRHMEKMEQARQMGLMHYRHYRQHLGIVRAGVIELAARRPPKKP